MVIFNKARKKCSRFLISQEGRLKGHLSFTSLLQNNLFRETVFSLLQLVRKQENREYRIQNRITIPTLFCRSQVKLDTRRRRIRREESRASAPSCIRRPDCYSVTVERSTGSRLPPTSRRGRSSRDDLVSCTVQVQSVAADRNVGHYSDICVPNNFGTHLYNTTKEVDCHYQ
jgi:hypothetical protein